MYVRNILSSGDFLTVVPVGIPVTLQYSDKGILEKVYYYFDDKKILATDILSTMLSACTAPVKISVTGGTTWVEGVLYTSERVAGCGRLPECVVESLSQLYVEHPDKFNFFAGNVESLATQFKGAAPIRRWLSMSKFNLLPGKILPATADESIIEHLFNTDTYPFKWPLVTHYVVHNKDGVQFISTELSQHVVTAVTRGTDTSGFIHADIAVNNGTDTYRKSYSDIVRFNIFPGTVLVLDSNKNITYSYNDTDEKHSHTIACSTCGCKIDVPKTGLVCCTDSHCMSKLYPTAVRMLNIFDLPTISYSEYIEYVKNGDITSLSDILLLDCYKSFEISTSLKSVIQAIVPESTIVSGEVFQIFVNRCNNSVKTAQYYLTHPDKILSDLQMSGRDANTFVTWLADGYNVSEIEAILDSPQIHLDSVIKKFDGAPIFRNKTIMITGKFKHGDYSEIIAILQSYSASVVLDLSEKVDCVVVGDLREAVNGPAIRSARNLNIPIYQESSFFENYDIDADLRQNL